MGLFDSRKETKSIKLVKKLQEQADLEWERELEQRKEQERNDEAIAKELQAQLQDEHSPTLNSVNSTPLLPPRTQSTTSLPPPLPSKPRAYNSSTSLGVLTKTNQSSNSLPTSQSHSSLLPKPLYSMHSSSSHPELPPRQHDSSTSKKPVKSYLPSRIYQPELQLSVASPIPVASSVFYQETPKINPMVMSCSSPNHNNTSPPDVDVPTHMNMPEPINTSKRDTILLQQQQVNPSTIPIATPYPPQFRRGDSSPIVLPLSSNDISHNQSYNNSRYNNTPPVPQGYNSEQSYHTPPVSQSYNNATPTQQTFNGKTSPDAQNYNSTTPPAHNYSNTPPAVQNYNNTPPTRQTYNSSTPPAVQNYSNTPPAVQSYSNTPPAVQSYSNTPPAVQNYSNTPAAVQNYNNTPPAAQNYDNTPPTQQHFNSTTSLPRYNTPIQHSNYSTPPTQNYPLHNSTSVNATLPLNKQKQGVSTNPYSKNKQTTKPVFSNSVMTLKPDEEQPEEQKDEDNEWDILPTEIKRVHTPPPPPSGSISDTDSEYDYSDMIYDRRIEEVDPFADSFAVPSAVNALENSIQIIEPTLLNRQLSTKIAVEDEEKKDFENKVSSQKESVEEELVHKYVEKESEEIEARPLQTPFFKSVEKTPIHQQPLFYNQTSVEEEDGVKVFPTNILRAGAPPQMSATNPYSKKQGAVPTSDYGYYKENEKPKDKILPKVPPPQQTTSPEDRHITVASINPGQRVWIRIHPTDTGKILAERIHIVASYQTRRVTKITTKNGRNISLDNSPLFDDWNEIINFVEGEAWTVEWVPIESPYIDILTEGKEFMKFLKANFRGSSSNTQ